MKIIILMLIASEILNISIGFAQPGTLDNTFGINGKVTISFGTEEDIGRKAALAADGKIVQTGTAGKKVAVLRYNTDGTPDSSFDGDGKTTTSIHGYDDEGYDVAIQPDGKIVVGGSSNADTGVPDFALVRYNTDGSLDLTFNHTGKVTTDLGSDDVCRSLVIQSDGKIVAGGYSGANTNIALVRYNPDGSIDKSFSGDGKVIMSVGTAFTDVFSIIMQPDGKILVAGDADVDFLLVRYNVNGSLDKSFDGDGIVTTDINGNGFTDFGWSVALQPDGKIIVVGSTYIPPIAFGAVRYNANGSLDTSFDGDGKVTTIIGSDYGIAKSVVVQSNGLIIIAGESDDNFALERYNSDGSIDNTFGTTGLVTTDFNNGEDQPWSVIFTPDHKIVVTGSSSSFGFAAARYNSESALPIALVNFIVKLKGDDGLLNWSTATDQNSDYFNIQRSLDGVHFYSISKVNAAGSSNIYEQYSYTDANITALSSGGVYYRLQLVDKDGSTIYSAVRSIELNNTRSFTIYPNPADDIIFVRANGKAVVSLTDQSGRILITETVDGNGSINVRHLPSGIYYLKNNSTGEIQKVVVKR